MTLNEIEKKKIINMVSLFLILVSIFFVVEIVKGVREYGVIGRQDIQTISVTGEGEVFAVPDIARVSFVVRQESKTMKEAQTVVSEKVDATLLMLEKMGIEEKDIKTIGYNAYPKYETQRSSEVVCMGIGVCPPIPQGKQVISGYEVSQNIEVKVRDTDNASTIIDNLASLKVSDISGPDFSIDDTDLLNEQARKSAIEDAKEKARVLENDLGIRLGRIVSFNESGAYPYYYAERAQSLDSAVGAGSPAPKVSLPTGESKITSNVTITYEIR